VDMTNVTAKKLALSLIQRPLMDLLRRELTLQGLAEGEDFNSSTGVTDLKKILWKKLGLPKSEKSFHPKCKELDEVCNGIVDRLQQRLLACVNDAKTKVKRMISTMRRTMIQQDAHHFR
jgi:hypothetical protein